MKRWGDNPGWRHIAQYALTPAGGIILCIICALLCALGVGYILAWMGWL